MRALTWLTLALACALIVSSLLTGQVNLPTAHQSWGSQSYPWLVSLALAGGAAGLVIGALRGKLDWGGPLLWAWLIAIPLGVASAVTRYDALVTAGYLLAGAWLYLGLRQVRNQAVLWTALGSGGLLGGWATWQELSGLKTPAYWLGATAHPFTRAYASLHNPNVLAGALLLTLGASAALLPKGGWRWPWAAALLLQLGGLLFTFSRGGYFGLGVGLLVLIWRLPWRRRWLALGGGLVVVLALLLAPQFRQRVVGLAQPAKSAAASRLFLWEAAWRIWETHPLLGSGWGGYNQLYPGARPVGARGTYVLINPPVGAHNDWLQLLSELGLIGVALLACGLALSWWQRPPRRLSWRELATLAGLIALATQSLVEANLDVPALYLSALALAATLPGLQSGPRPSRAAARWVAGLLAAASLGAVASGLPWRPAQLEQMLGEAAAQPARAVRLAREAQQLVPISPDAWLAGARAQANLALGARKPWASPYWRGARREARRAAQLDPAWSAPLALLAEADLVTGHVGAALAEQERAVRRNGYDPYLLQALGVDAQRDHRRKLACLAWAQAASLLPLQVRTLKTHHAPLSQRRGAQAALRSLTAERSGCPHAPAPRLGELPR